MTVVRTLADVIVVTTVTLEMSTARSDIVISHSDRSDSNDSRPSSDSNDSRPISDSTYIHDSSNCRECSDNFNISDSSFSSDIIEKSKSGASTDLLNVQSFTQP